MLDIHDFVHLFKNAASIKQNLCREVYFLFIISSIKKRTFLNETFVCGGGAKKETYDSPKGSADSASSAAFILMPTPFTSTPSSALIITYLAPSMTLVSSK